MHGILLAGALAGALSLASATPGRAQLFGVISEVKVGGLAHDIGFLGSNIEPGPDLMAEIVFVAPDLYRGSSEILDRLLEPTPHLGVQVNLEGATSQLYAGLTWTAYPFEGFGVPLWIAGHAGGTVHDGELRSVEPDEKSLGSRVLFRLAAEVGYDVTENIRVSIYYDHESNAGLAEENQGLNNAGLRLGWRF